MSGGDEQTLQQTYFPEGSASCVQNFDDSLDSAIRMTYRISLRSSSLWEPRHPLLKVLIRYHYLTSHVRRLMQSYYDEFLITFRLKTSSLLSYPVRIVKSTLGSPKRTERLLPVTLRFCFLLQKTKLQGHRHVHGSFTCPCPPFRKKKRQTQRNKVEECGNDPSAGSPTETLLRLHLPLNVEV